MNNENVTSLSYERMVEDALRGVLRRALEITEEHGLPGKHHFYVTFETTHAGVHMADSLRVMHPSEMTIVLQHQFRDLCVEEDSFDITLTFSGVSQRLHIPFAAVTAFADPHAKFGLQFHVEFEDADVEEGYESEFENEDNYEMPAVDNVVVTQRLNTERLARNETSEEPDPDPEKDAGKVVTLDTFRKK